MSFINKSIGFALCTNGALNVSYLIKTTNGGLSWFLWSTINSQIAFSSCISDTNNVFVAGDVNIEKTTNGGSSWIYKGMTSAIFRSMYFTDSNTGYIAGDYNSSTSGIIMKTTNSGSSWFVQTSSILYTLNSIYFTDSINGCAVGNTGMILKTTNGGATWIDESGSIKTNLGSIVFTDANTGYAAGENVIIKTTDAGKSWKTLISTLSILFNILIFLFTAVFKKLLINGPKN